MKTLYHLLTAVFVTLGLTMAAADAGTRGVNNGRSGFTNIPVTKQQIKNKQKRADQRAAEAAALPVREERKAVAKDGTSKRPGDAKFKRVYRRVFRR